MVRPLRHAVFGTLCVLASAATVSAQSVSSVLQNFGLFGTWAMHCGAAAATTNIIQTTPLGREPVEFSATIAPGTAGNHYRIISARMPGPTTLVLQVELNRSSIEYLTIVKNGVWVRTVTNQPAQGGLLVRDGVVLANGGMTPWFQKCQ